MQHHRFGDLLPDGQHGVQRGHRLLEDHGDAVAADLAHLIFRQLQEIGPVEEDLAVHDLARGLGDQAHHGEGVHTLAAARLANDAQGLSFAQFIGEAVDSLHDAFVGVEIGFQVADRQ